MLANMLTDEARCLYETLLGSDGLPVGQLTRVRGGDAPLAELLSHGLVRECVGPPRRFLPVPPTTAVHRLLAIHHRQLADAHARLAERYAPRTQAPSGSVIDAGRSDAAGTGPAAPTPDQLQVLRLASTGLKDEAIARSLGRSSRWVRRHIEELEGRLGASNRLTLGIAAARRGWV